MCRFEFDSVTVSIAGVLSVPELNSILGLTLRLHVTITGTIPELVCPLQCSIVSVYAGLLLCRGVHMSCVGGFC